MNEQLTLDIPQPIAPAPPVADPDAVRREQWIRAIAQWQGIPLEGIFSGRKSLEALSDEDLRIELYAIGKTHAWLYKEPKHRDIEPYMQGWDG